MKTSDHSFSPILLIKKCIVLALGLFVLAFGIALSSKSGIGVSPSASLSYVLSLIFPPSMGTFTMLVNAVFILVQLLLLGKNYKPVNLLQASVVFAFGYFTDLTLAIVAPLKIETYPLRLILCVVSCIIMAFGVFLEVKASLIVMASEGAISVISDKTHLDFGTVKIILDWGFIALSCMISLIVFHGLNGVREGIVIAAFLVGFFIRFYNRRVHFVDRFLGTDADASSAAPLPQVPGIDTYPLVITIERELGSGGHQIGLEVSRRLGIPFYDYELIAETARATGLAADQVQKGEERMGIGILSELYKNSYAESQIRSREEEIFRGQVQVIRDLASRESCVIVGRLGGYILRDRPNTLNLFFSADRRFRAERIAAEKGLSIEKALRLVKREDQTRAAYCLHFTGTPWGLAAHYGMTLHTSDYGIENSVNMVMVALEQARDHIVSHSGTDA